jgi:hypothetical protein
VAFAQSTWETRKRLASSRSGVEPGRSGGTFVWGSRSGTFSSCLGTASMGVLSVAIRMGHQALN